jgi:RimJ/RimL family protein N-acetyltransferase
LHFQEVPLPYGFFNIFPKGMDVSVGHCSFSPSFCNSENRTLIATEREPHASLASIEVDIGWAIMKSYRRKGFATEAAQGVIKYGFEILKLPRIVAGTDRDNIASQKVMEKLGLRLFNQPDGVGIIGVIANPCRAIAF